MKHTTHRILAILLSAVLALGLAAPALAADADLTFRDVPEDHWAYAAIMEMVRRGVFNGVTRRTRTASPPSSRTRP